MGLTSAFLWPQSIPPLQQESFLSWWARAAFDFGLSPRGLDRWAATKLGLNLLKGRALDLRLPDDPVLKTLCQTSRLQKSCFRATLLPPRYPAIDEPEVTRLQGAEGTVPSAPEHWMFWVYAGVQSAFCPQCLREDEQPYFRREWRYLTTVYCEVHKRALRDTCQRCGQAQGGFRKTSGRDGLRFCEHCQADLGSQRSQRGTSSTWPCSTMSGQLASLLDGRAVLTYRNHDSTEIAYDPTSVLQSFLRWVALSTRPYLNLWCAELGPVSLTLPWQQLSLAERAACVLAFSRFVVATPEEMESKSWETQESLKASMNFEELCRRARMTFQPGCPVLFQHPWTATPKKSQETRPNPVHNHINNANDDHTPDNNLSVPSSSLMFGITSDHVSLETQSFSTVDAYEFAGCSPVNQIVYSIWWTDNLGEPMKYLNCCSSREQAKYLIAEHCRDDVIFSDLLNILYARGFIRKWKQDKKDGQKTVISSRHRFYFVTNQQLDLSRPSFDHEADSSGQYRLSPLL